MNSRADIKDRRQNIFPKEHKHTSLDSVFGGSREDDLCLWRFIRVKINARRSKVTPPSIRLILFLTLLAVCSKYNTVFKKQVKHHLCNTRVGSANENDPYCMSQPGERMGRGSLLTVAFKMRIFVRNVYYWYMIFQVLNINYNVKSSPANLS